MMVVGAKGGGKSTLAHKIAELTGTDHHDLDVYYRHPDGTKKSRSEFHAIVSDIVVRSNWIVDGDCVEGDFEQLRDVVWPKATTIVWLDPPFTSVMWRLSRRTFIRLSGREKLWHGNVESGSAVLDRVKKFDAVKSYWIRKKRYAEFIRRPEYARLEIVRLKNTAQAKTWLQGLANPG